MQSLYKMAPLPLATTAYWVLEKQSTARLTRRRDAQDNRLHLPKLNLQAASLYQAQKNYRIVRLDYCSAVFVIEAQVDTKDSDAMGGSRALSGSRALWG